MAVFKKETQLHTPFEKIILSSRCPYLALKKAVVVQAITDVINDTSFNREVRIKKYNAAKWIFELNMKNSTFEDACKECDLEPGIVRRLAKKIMIRNGYIQRSKEDNF